MRGEAKVAMSSDDDDSSMGRKVVAKVIGDDCGAGDVRSKLGAEVSVEVNGDGDDGKWKDKCAVKTKSLASKAHD